MREVWRCVCGAYNGVRRKSCWNCNEHGDKFQTQFVLDKKEVVKMADKEWTKAGTLRMSKKGEQIVLVVEGQRYVVNAAATVNVLNGTKAYAGISKPPADKKESG